jgi:hypothetical protein
MDQLIKASEFAKYLKNEGLVIVSKSELERISGIRIAQKRNDLLKRTFLTLREILSLDLLPVKSKTTLERWIQNGTFLKSEVSKNDKEQTIVLTSALKRLGYVA